MVRTDSALPRTRSRSRDSPCHSSGSVATAARRRRRRRVDDRAAGQHDDEGVQGAVGVLLRAAGHAAGVVGDDPADGAGDLAGRVGAELAAVRCEVGVDVRGPSRRAAPAPGRRRRAPRPPERCARVGEDAVGDPLAGQAGAAGAEGQRHAALVAGAGTAPPTSAAVRGVATDSGDQQVVRGVVGHLEPIRGPGAGRHPVCVVVPMSAPPAGDVLPAGPPTTPVPACHGPRTPSRPPGGAARDRVQCAAAGNAGRAPASAPVPSTAWYRQANDPSGCSDRASQP